MPKRTAVIDIGSNSARLVIYQKTSRYGFHLICEQKSRVRIGEGAYKNNGLLQTIGINRAFGTLESFADTIKNYHVDNVLAVATSALRDAPNKNTFIDRVKKELGLDINIIDGTEEARLGAIAAYNLLPFTDGITIDIGGGSSDIALIQNGQITDTFSLNIGTVRLKELYFDKNSKISNAKKYIHKELEKLPKVFTSNTAIGIGGTIRTLAKAIIKNTNYPLNKIHAFKYEFDDYQDYFKEIIHADIRELDKLFVKKNRHDTIREGTLIFTEILEHINATTIITSSVGVREGVYLSHMLRNADPSLSSKLNLSIRSIKDRFDILSLPRNKKRHVAEKVYSLFENKLENDRDYFNLINRSLSISHIGKLLTIYNYNKHAYYIATQELNYGFSHKEITLISLLLYSSKESKYPKELYKQYHMLLPAKKSVKWLVFIYNLTLILHEHASGSELGFSLRKNILKIHTKHNLYLAKEAIKNMKVPKKIKIVIG